MYVWGRAGQLQSTRAPCNSLRTRLSDARVNTYIERGPSELNGRQLFTDKKFTLKVQLNNEAVGLTKLSKTHRMVYCVLPWKCWVTICKHFLCWLSCHIVFCRHIMFVKLYYWNWSDDWRPYVLPQIAAMLASPGLGGSGRSQVSPLPDFLSSERLIFPKKISYPRPNFFVPIHLVTLMMQAVLSLLRNVEPLKSRRLSRNVVNQLTT